MLRIDLHSEKVQLQNHVFITKVSFWRLLARCCWEIYFTSLRPNTLQRTVWLIIFPFSFSNQPTNVWKATSSFSSGNDLSIARDTVFLDHYLASDDLIHVFVLSRKERLRLESWKGADLILSWVFDLTDEKILVQTG